MSPASRLPASILGCALLPAVLPASAADCGGALGLNSENIYRGISQSEGRVSVFGDAHCTFAPSWVAGIGASTIRTPSASTDVQLTAYIDRHWRLGDDWSAKLGIVHFEPLRAANRVGYRYDEINAAIGFRGRWLTSVAWTPRVGNAYIGTPAGYNGWLRIETAWRQPLGGHLSLDAGIGYAHPTGAPPQSYHYANLALTAAVGDVYFGLNRIWTSSRTFRYTELDPPFEFTFGAERFWLGSAVWLF